METLLLPHFTTKRAVPVTTIEYLEAMGNYTMVHMTDQKPMLVALTLKRFAERLPGFIRIHKGTLVNPCHIISYRAQYTGMPYVQLSQDRQLTISRRQIRRLRTQLTSFGQLVN